MSRKTVLWFGSRVTNLPIKDVWQFVQRLNRWFLCVHPSIMSVYPNPVKTCKTRCTDVQFVLVSDIDGFRRCWLHNLTCVMEYLWVWFGASTILRVGASPWHTCLGPFPNSPWISHNSLWEKYPFPLISPGGYVIKSAFVFYPQWPRHISPFTP